MRDAGRVGSRFIEGGWILIVVALLVACSQPASAPDSPKSDLENAALEAGLITDPDTLDLAGTFETRSALGADRFCAIGSRDAGYDIGMLAVFGGDSQCEARGKASISGETIAIELAEDGDSKAIKKCSFLAFFDGVVIRLPGQLPQACADACSNRASFAGVTFSIVESGSDAALNMRGRNLARLCQRN